MKKSKKKKPQKEPLPLIKEKVRIDLREEYRYSLFADWEYRDLSATIIACQEERPADRDKPDSVILSFTGDPVIQSYDGGQTWDYYDGKRHWPKANLILKSKRRLSYSTALMAIHGGRKFQRSEDGGVTWGKEHTIPSAKEMHFDRLSGALCFDGILTRRGRIVLANSYWTGQEGPDGELLSTTVSDDWGETWEVSPLFGPAAPLPSGPEGFGEVSIVELKSGWLWMVFRTLYGELWQCISLDQGLSWYPPTPTGLVSPIANCFAARHPDSGATVLAWNMTKPGTDLSFRSPGSLYRPRMNLVFAVSQDNCRTWSCPVVVDEGSALYPKIFFAGDDMLIVYQSSSKAGYRWDELGLTLVTYDKTEVDMLPAWTTETIQPYIDKGLVRHWLSVACRPPSKETIS